MQVIIRKAGEQDLRSLLDMYDELYRILIGEYGFPFEFSREENRGALTVQLRSKLVNILVAELNGEVIGFVHASISRLDRRLSRGDLKAIGRIDDIYVRGRFRGSGAARELLEGAEAWFRAEEVDMVESYILDKNAESRRFHEKNGYKPMSVRMYKTL
ncbi:MAG: GNAT family N-acetyltransferase [Oscillospiraceae bacterium]|jgi:GNAT superfamily N-acetyltransferase